MSVMHSEQYGRRTLMSIILAPATSGGCLAGSFRGKAGAESGCATCAAAAVARCCSRAAALCALRSSSAGGLYAEERTTAEGCRGRSKPRQGIVTYALHGV